MSESIQQRHAWVYLNASIWAEWSGGQSSGGNAQTYVIGAIEPSQCATSGGPLLQLVQAQGAADPYWSGEHSPNQRGTYWDHDCLPTIVLYNRTALVVIDRNGGRITQVFGWVDGRPISGERNDQVASVLDPGPHRPDPVRRRTAAEHRVHAESLLCGLGRRPSRVAARYVRRPEGSPTSGS